MGTSSMIATNLDAEMLLARGVPISPASAADASLPLISRAALFDQLGGHWLIRYVRASSLTDYNPRTRPSHFTGPAYVTPTPYEPDELIPWLALPPHLPTPQYAVFLDPRQLDAVGPRWVRLGAGLEYLLPSGFPATALVPPSWPIRVR